MALINHSKREINAKIVFFGPPGVGKGSLFSYIHQCIKPTLCGPLKSMPSGDGKLLFFDYLPFDRRSTEGYQVRFHLYTLSGRVENLARWKMILKGVDGLAVVAESGKENSEDMLSSMQMLSAVFSSYGQSITAIPLVLISNKTDLVSNTPFNWGVEFSGRPRLGTSAVTGEGALNALATLSQDMLKELRSLDKQEADFDLSPFHGEDNEPQESVEILEPGCLSPDLPSTDSESEILLRPAGTASVKMPFEILVDGKPRRFLINADISIQEESHGPDSA